MAFSKQIVQKVWEKGRVVPGKDPDELRKDECGAWVKRNHYGNRKSNYGWEIDHITAGGSEDLTNLRVLQWQNYLAGGIGKAICKVIADDGDVRNKEK